MQFSIPHESVSLCSEILFVSFVSLSSLQLVLSGRSEPAALRSVSVSSRTLWSVTGAMAPASVNLVTGATPARKVSTMS